LTTSNSRFLALGLLLAVLASAVAVAQVRDTELIKVKPLKPQVVKFKGEVLHMTGLAITVRAHENYNLVRTFTFAEKLARQMAELCDRNRPYQYGDRVEIHYLAGSDTAVKLKGKPSKPIPGLRP